MKIIKYLLIMCAPLLFGAYSLSEYGESKPHLAVVGIIKKKKPPSPCKQVWYYNLEGEDYYICQDSDGFRTKAPNGMMYSYGLGFTKRDVMRRNNLAQEDQYCFLKNFTTCKCE